MSMFLPRCSVPSLAFQDLTRNLEAFICLEVVHLSSRQRPFGIFPEILPLGIFAVHPSSGPSLQDWLAWVQVLALSGFPL